MSLVASALLALGLLVAPPVAPPAAAASGGLYTKADATYAVDPTNHVVHVSVAVVAVLLNASPWIVVPALMIAATFGLSWNGLSFTATAETAGRARSGAAIGLQQTFLAVGGLIAPIAFAAIVHQVSWRAAFALAALSPLVGYTLLSPLAERRP